MTVCFDVYIFWTTDCIVRQCVCKKMGLLCSRLRAQQWLKMAVTVHIFWTAEPVVTKLDILMHHYEHQSNVMQKEWFAIFKPVRVRVTVRVHMIKLWLNWLGRLSELLILLEPNLNLMIILLSWAGVYYEKILLCQSRGLDLFILASLGCLLFACLFWEVYNFENCLTGFCLFLHVVAVGGCWLVAPLDAVPFQGKDWRCSVVFAMKMKLHCWIWFFFFSFHHVVSKWSWADAVLLVLFFFSPELLCWWPSPSWRQEWSMKMLWNSLDSEYLIASLSLCLSSLTDHHSQGGRD